MTWRVADVMTTEVVTVGPETGFKSCVDMLRVHSISALPVIAADGALLTHRANTGTYVRRLLRLG